MSFNGTEGGEITLNEASAMTLNYRRNNPNEILAHFFGRDILTELLNQPECVGIRMYYGISGDGKKELVLVAVDQDENDLTQLVADISIPCPKACGTQNALNS